MARVRRGRRLLPPHLRGPVLRRLRAVLPPRRARRVGTLSGAPALPERVVEENWFFRLSRYADRLRDEITSGRVRVNPPAKRNEALAFIEAGLEDFSVSRPATRSGGWGIPVPGDPSQVVYVWWDALTNYVTALGYGSDPTDPGPPRTTAPGGRRATSACT
ncbi:class I tRNA ligase family protein [Oerskovia sp. M15]